MNKIFVGFRLHPADEELKNLYLASKGFNGSFFGVKVIEVDLNKCEPWELLGNEVKCCSIVGEAGAGPFWLIFLAHWESELATQLRSINVEFCNLRGSSVKAIYAPEFYAPEKSSRLGIWSIRDDLQVPSSPYFLAYAQRGTGSTSNGPRALYECYQPTFSICKAFLHELTEVSGMAIFDTMRHIRPDVSTVCVGLAASFLLSQMVLHFEGKIYSLPNSRIMIHEPLGGAQGGQTDIDIQACENGSLIEQDDFGFIFSLKFFVGLEKINQDTDRDFFMSAKEAKEYGLIDGVSLNPLKALQPLAAATEKQ
ncbi:ATP-dependent Clp protease proteolytic subunit, chloroplastic [Sesamum alatum]|uniref:ATP-dependent Clp protease proteolytic subunit n=1 Tax=Sesamum alatum TaxID=300844 RepID=A0AAE1Z5J1_9LAMI|nr:ATP-dependent Clp protease proteolytic subunit, chloroplastic [Sesamum alatum]